MAVALGGEICDAGMDKWHALADSHASRMSVRRPLSLPCPCSKHTIGSGLCVNLFILTIDCMVNTQMDVSNAVAGVNTHCMPI